MSTEERRENVNPEVCEVEEEISEEVLSEQRVIRREKLKALQEAGRNPFLEENWNVTHRFGGKVWVAGGVVILFGILLPQEYSLFLHADL